MKFKEFILKSGAKALLGRNEENNDELVSLYKGKENIILHTSAPGSPFCVIDSLNPSKEDICEASIACASKSQDWRDNKSDVIMHQFTGKDVNKGKEMKKGTWNVKKYKTIKIKKADIEGFRWQ